MPKNRGSKGASGSGSAKGTPKRVPGLKSAKRTGTSDEDSINGDGASVISLNSDRGSYEDVVENGNVEVECESDGTPLSPHSRESLEEKLNESIESMMDKSAGVRSGALTTLTTLLSQNYVPELLVGRRETLRDYVEKIFKRGTRVDQGPAAGLVSLSALTIGSYDLDLATQDYNLIRPFIQVLFNDHTAPITVRIKCCQALCMGAFLAESSLDDIGSILMMLESIFSSGLGKKIVEIETSSTTPSGGGSKTVKGTCGTLVAAAISGWSLLITLMPPEYLVRGVGKWLRVFQSLLDDPELEVRLNAGEGLALLVEICQLEEESESEDEVSPGGGRENAVHLRSLITKLKELSVQSHKYQAKKDRRQQRHSFRDYLHAVQDGDGPGQNIKFGYGEVLEIDSWVKKRQYDAICQILGSGMNRHLLDNALVRQILGLGAVRPAFVDSAGAKAAKSERQFQNHANFKARCVSRGKAREQRMANLEEF